jgi:hypothetical protein
MLRAHHTKHIHVEDNFVKPKFINILFVVSFVLLFFSLVAFSLYVDLAKDEWIYGDWIINYSSGFIRRGLIGSIILSQSVISPPSALALIHIFLYAAFTGMLMSEFWPHRNNLLIMMLLFSPLGLLFFVYNHSTIGRKEILFFVAILFQIRALAKLGVGRTNEVVYLIALVVLSGTIILSHDGSYFFCPFLDTVFFIFMIKRRSVIAALSMVGIAFSVQSVIFLACYKHKGSYQSVQSICSSLGSFAPYGPTKGVFSPQGALSPGNCLETGGIAQLGLDSTDAMNLVARYVSGYPMTYGITALIGLLSLAFLFRNYRLRVRRPEAIAIVALMLLSVGCTIPLYVVATDWGRWMQITYLSIMFVTVYLIDVSYLVPKNLGVGLHYLFPIKKIPLGSLMFALLAGGVFLFGWSVPNCCTERVGFGVFEFVLKAFGISNQFRNLAAATLA